MGVLHRLSVCGGKDPSGLVASGQEATLGIWKIPELSSGLSKSFCYSSASVSPLALELETMEPLAPRGPWKMEWGALVFQWLSWVSSGPERSDCSFTTKCDLLAV